MDAVQVNGKNSKNPDDVGRSFVAVRGEPIAKESRDGETATLQERKHVTVKMGYGGG